MLNHKLAFTDTSHSLVTVEIDYGDTSILGECSSIEIDSGLLAISEPDYYDGQATGSLTIYNTVYDFSIIFNGPGDGICASILNSCNGPVDIAVLIDSYLRQLRIRILD